MDVWLSKNGRFFSLFNAFALTLHKHTVNISVKFGRTLSRIVPLAMQWPCRLKLWKCYKFCSKSHSMNGCQRISAFYSFGVSFALVFGNSSKERFTILQLSSIFHSNLLSIICKCKIDTATANHWIVFFLF